MEHTEQFKNAYNYYEAIRKTWKEKEALILAKNTDSHSNTTKSDVHDPRLVSIMMERSFRVMSQMASGKVQAMSREDRGKSLFMDLILDKYVIPNANQQRDMLTKYRMVDFYSLVYGSFGILVDWHVSDTYTGPDFRLIPIRDLVPQPGKTSIGDCEYVYVRTEVSRSWLETILKRDKTSWNKKAVEKLLEATKGEVKTNSTFLDLSFSEGKYNDVFSETDKSKNMISLVTKYENDKWTTFALDYPGEVLRESDNPHRNDKLPIVVKDAFPILDRFHGLGEIERGISLQKSINSLINLYLDGVKFSLYPPLMIDANNVVMSTIKIEGGAKWLVKNGQMNAVTPHQINPQGINTFQSTYSFLIAALMNQAGTTDTTVSQGTDPGLGKTPQALQLLSERQNSRDAYDRFQMEQFVEKTYDIFLDLLAKKQEEPIKISLLKDEIQRIEKFDPDIVEMFESGKAGELTIAPEQLKDGDDYCDYKFYIEPGSTYKREEAIENQSLVEMLQLVMSLPNAAEQIAQNGSVQIGDHVIDIAEMVKRLMVVKGIQDWDNIIKPVEEAGLEGNVEDPELMRMMEEIQAGIPRSEPPMGPEMMPEQGMAPGMI